MKITEYSAQTSNRSIGYHLLGIVRDLPAAHELGSRLFIRNLKAQYRQSMLGFAWALIPPLVTAALWIFLKGNGVMAMGDTGMSYPVFVFTGTMLWQIFAESMQAPLKSVSSNKSMLAKINIPREGLLLAGLYEVLFNILIKLGLLILILLWFRQTVAPESLLLFPVGVLALVMAGFALGLALVPVGMLFSDIERGVSVALPFLMYLTPVIYPYPKSGTIATLMSFNPMAAILPQARNWLTAQPAADNHLFWIWSAIFLGLFLLALVVYRIAMPMIIERIGS